jgi:3-oxoacyl-[acyl-carrier-protein] synthase-1
MKYFLSALGIICPLGKNKEEVFTNLIAGSTSGVIPRDGFIPNKSVALGSVTSQLPKMPPALKSHDTRCNRLLLAAYLQIETEVQDAIKKYGKNRIAIIIGSGTSDIDEVQQAIDHCIQTNAKLPPLDDSSLEIASPSQFLAECTGLSNISYTVSTACTSSAKAFIAAQNLLNLGLCDAVLVGGADNLCKLTVNGFYALESISEKVCNPFSKNRNGITLGEGAAIFLMTKEQSEIALLGAGESSDAYHKTSPDPQGKGALSAMQKALQQAALNPDDVDYLNLHGTGTILNDSMESLAVATLSDKIYCSSTKPLTGHTLGSAGVIEIALCWLLLSPLNHDNYLPPHIWDGEADESLAKLNFVEKNKKLQKLSICMSNSFAFGGSNASLIIGKACTKA